MVNQGTASCLHIETRDDSTGHTPAGEQSAFHVALPNLACGVSSKVEVVDLGHFISFVFLEAGKDAWRVERSVASRGVWSESLVHLEHLCRIVGLWTEKRGKELEDDALAFTFVWVLMQEAA